MAILEDVKKELSKDADIKDMAYEGSELIYYTKNKEFFSNSSQDVRKLVSKFKKRIAIRADPSIIADEEETKEFIQKTVPEEAGIKDIYFEPEFAKVVIHAEKPGLVIGKSGDTLLKIKNTTFWTPDIRRAPVIDSEIIKNIRKMLHAEAGYRKKFLDGVGKKIYEEPKDLEWIRLSALGAFRQVGKSAVLVQTPQSRILLDCGIDVSATSTRPYPYLDAPEFQIQALDAVVISHAHLDHCGFLPFLYEHGYRGPVYCTRPTRDTMVLLQLDYLQICQKENKKAPYTSKAIEEMVKHCIPLEYGEVSDITPDVRLTLNNAGHILGSATTHLNIGNGQYNFLYTGDIKYERTKMFDAAYADYTRVECVLIEGTYGAKTDTIPKDEKGEEFLIKKIKKAKERGGKVLIPSFAVGRAQEVIAMITDSNIDIPIYLDGMLWDATAINTAYPEFMSKEMQSKILHKGKNPFTDKRLHGVGSHQERLALLESEEPCVIISTSGMMVGGPIMSYLEKFGGDEKNMLLFVGYQAEGTTGKRIQKGWKTIQTNEGKTLELNLEVDTIKGMSGHSDFSELMAFIKAFKTRPRKILVDHCESSKCVEFAKEAHKYFRVETMAPKLLETIRLK
jgi:uncharacterized protein